MAHILQFQLYKALCVASGEYLPNGNIPLHSCDFYGSLPAGEKLRYVGTTSGTSCCIIGCLNLMNHILVCREGLSLGSSKHWSEVLEIMTGEKELSAEPILEYFQPLYNFLKEYNTSH